MSTTAAGADVATLEAADVRFGQVGIANVRVRSIEPAALRAAIELRVREAPALFERAPVVIDLSFLAPFPDDDLARALLDAARAAGVLPVGLAYGDDATDALARRLGLPLIAKFREAYQRAGVAGSAPHPEPAAESAAPVQPDPAREPAAALLQRRPVRTGQQVYAHDRDLVVVGHVANGAEILADGNIHVYGALRGRAFAGASGDKTACIFCQEFRAEIVSIAGHYRVFEELPKEFARRAVQIRLDQDKLQISPL